MRKNDSKIILFSLQTVSPYGLFRDESFELNFFSYASFMKSFAQTKPLVSDFAVYSLYFFHFFVFCRRLKILYGFLRTLSFTKAKRLFVSELCMAAGNASVQK